MFASGNDQKTLFYLRRISKVMEPEAEKEQELWDRFKETKGNCDHECVPWVLPRTPISKTGHTGYCCFWKSHGNLLQWLQIHQIFLFQSVSTFSIWSYIVRNRIGSIWIICSLLIWPFLFFTLNFILSNTDIAPTPFLSFCIFLRYVFPSIYLQPYCT